MHFIRLIRPVNLAIIVLTMYGVNFYIHSLTFKLIFNPFDFGLLVFSTVLIAAAGNIINDYFDIKADRINKPKRMIISKHIKRRWAILMHWALSIIAFFIAAYLSWKYHTFWFLIIHTTSIFFLWLYSIRLKKIPLLGNMVISLLTVLVIFLTLFLSKKATGDVIFNEQITTTLDPLFSIPIKWIILIFMGMAFFQNLLREIVKDIEDIPGDKAIHAKTLPMVIGIRASLIIVGFFLVTFPIIYFIGIPIYFPQFDWKLSIPISIAAIINGIGFFISFSSQKSAIVALKYCLKGSMFAGVIYLFLHG